MDFNEREIVFSDFGKNHAEGILILYFSFFLPFFLLSLLPFILPFLQILVRLI